MRILYITNSPIEYSSSANIRNKSLIAGLIFWGNQVDILTPVPDKGMTYYDSSILDNIKCELIYIDLEKANNLHVLGKKSRIYLKVRELISKLFNLFSIYDPRIRNLKYVSPKKYFDKYDLIISSSDPKSSHRIAEEIVDKNKTKWIQYWGDPFYFDINKKSLLPRNVIMEEEKRLLSKADAIVYVSPITHQNQSTMFYDYSQKMFFLPIPVILSEKNNESVTSEIIRLGYFGDYYSRDRDISPLLYACHEFEYSLNLIGNSDFQVEETNMVKVLKRISHSETKQFERECNILVCLCNKKGGQIPGKIFHYAAYNKPILLILDGEYQNQIRETFEKHKNYFICQNNPKSIHDTIELIKSSDWSFDPIYEFDYRTVAEKMLLLSRIEQNTNLL